MHTHVYLVHTSTHQLPATVRVPMFPTEGLFKMVDAKLQAKVLFLHLTKLLRRRCEVRRGEGGRGRGRKREGGGRGERRELTISWSFIVLVL